MPIGEVYLVGAGCGAADLITVRGLRLLKSCGAVVYDQLIDPALLEYVPPTARRICVGKRGGRPSPSQEEINSLLIALAQDGLRVARLKGGDPFVFGRGGEEMLALREAGIPCREVPGISSAIAIPAAAGIPVTHRGLSRSFHVITGHTAGDDLPGQLERLAGVEGTLIFLMGLGHLEEIARVLMAGGRSPDTPAAVLSGGNSPHPACVRGTLGDIAPRARDVLPPAVIVVGEVAGLELTSTISLPLEGVRVGVTGTDGVARKICSSLEALGACTFQIERPRVKALDWPLGVLEKGGPGGWLVFTSANGVDMFFQRLYRERRDVRSLSGFRFAVIGRATGAALEERGIFPHLCPEEQTSRGLALTLGAAARPGEEIILLRSDQGTPLLPALLRERGLEVTDVATYRVAEEEPGISTLPDLDYLTFESAGGVARFLARWGRIPPGCTCVCIGDVTAGALDGRTDRTPVVARHISGEGVAEAVLADWRKEQA